MAQSIRGFCYDVDHGLSIFVLGCRALTEEQAGQLIEVVTDSYELQQEAVKLNNTLLYAIFAALVTLACLLAIKAVRRG